jgi:hypothetical protein
LGFKADGAAVGKTGVESGAVVKGFDVIEDGGTSCGVGGEALMIDQFVFESAPEGLDKGIIVAVAFATHGSEQTVLSEKLSVCSAGELSSPIGVDDEGLARSPLS